MEVVTYKEAKAAGLKRFFSGTACSYGHLCERLTSNRGCIQCSKIRLKAWQKNNPEKVRALDNARHVRDREKRNAQKREFAKKNVTAATKRKREWAAKNRDKAWEIQKRWNDKNRNKINAYAANRRSLMYGAGRHTGEDIKRKYTEQQGLCNGCGEVLRKWHVDHIKPISKGGKNTQDNLQLLCKRCNLKKSSKSMDEFLRILHGEAERFKEQGNFRIT